MADERFERLPEHIRRIPGEGGWANRDSEATYQELGRMLLMRGFGVSDAVHFMTSVYRAAREDVRDRQ